MRAMQAPRTAAWPGEESSSSTASASTKVRMGLASVQSGGMCSRFAALERWKKGLHVLEIEDRGDLPQHPNVARASLLQRSVDVVERYDQQAQWGSLFKYST